MDEARERFVALVRDAVEVLNGRVAAGEGEFLAAQGGTKMEPVVMEALRSVAGANGFAESDIQLVSGSRFPDIIVAGRFGVEVKTTKDDSWKSIGSSIVESTRIDGIEEVYLLFAKLGGDIMFRARPYDECMSGIVVTHLPRYQIDMDIDPTDVIFDKLRISYDDFYRLDERSKVNHVRNYYKQLGEESGREVMPWWIGEESATRMNMTLFSSLPPTEKEEIRARAFVVFPSLFNSKYRRVSFWLCNRYSLINHNVRDSFSAGGQVSEIGGVTFASPLPMIIYNFYLLRDRVMELFRNPDEELFEDIGDYWEFAHDTADIFGSWKAEVNRIFAKRNYGVKIEEILAI